MYEAFYGLNEKPFNLTPDPRFLYLSAKHKEAFAHLLYGIRNRCGFVMVSGEIGTGKTTICRSLLKQLDPDTEVAFIFNPKLSPVELLQTINADFGITSKAETVRGLIDELNAHLLDRAAKGKNCVLIIDEAQNLGTETLEQIRLLSNLETETEKLLQIVLIGQPELAKKLELTELRQLNQRITARYHLGTLSGEETLHYIAFRLRVAGGRKKVKFTRSAVRTIHRISGGTPRVINALCDRALLIGYTKETRNIAPTIVRKASAEIQGAARPGRSYGGFRRFVPASLAAALIAAVGLGLWGLIERYDVSIGIIPSETASVWDLFKGDRVAGPPAETAPNPTVEPDAASPAPELAPPPRGESPNPASPPARGIVEAASVTPSDSPVSTEPLAPPAPAADTSNGAAIAAAGSEPAPSVEQVASLALPPVAEPMAEPAPVPAGPLPHQGLAELVRAWDLAILESPPAEISWTAVADFASANGLRMIGMSPSTSQIAAIDLPVLVRLRAGEDLEWVALLGLQNARARVIHGDGRTDEVPLETFRRDYTGDAFYLWDDPTPKAEPLRANTKTDAVLRLQEDLKSLGLIDRDPTGTYDVATIEAVGRIQRATGIAVDGVAGPQTRMVLSSWLDRSGAPNLSPAGFDDTLRARVLANPGMVQAKPAQVLESIPLPETLPAADTAAAAPATNEAGR
jgi:general secretion pathway protein A